MKKNMDLKMLDCRLVASLYPLFSEIRFHMGKCVLDGLDGVAYVDCEEKPRFAILLLKNYCFISGEIEVMNLQYVIERYKLKNYEFITTDDIFIKLRKIYQQKFICSTRYSLEKVQNFNIKLLKEYVRNLSSDYCLIEIDQQVANDIQNSGFINISKNYTKNGIGVCCVYNQEIIGVASSNIYYKDGIEVNIRVKEKFRRQKIATAMAAKLILICIKRNRFISWDAANIESLKLADKLGFIYHSSYPICEIISSIKRL